MFINFLGILLKRKFGFSRIGVELRLSVFNKFLGVVGVVGRYGLYFKY